MFQNSYRLLTAMGFAIGIPLAAGGLLFFLPLLVPLALLSLLVTVPMWAVHSFSESSLKTQLRKRLRIVGRHDLSERLKGHGKNLKGVSLQGLDLSEIGLKGVDFTRTSLMGTRMIKTNCERASFRDAFMRRTKMFFASFKGADFTNADLKNDKLQYADLRRARLHNTNMSGANLKGADLRQVEMHNVEWENAVYNSETKLPFSEKRAGQLGMHCVA